MHVRAADETPRRLHQLAQQREVEREMRRLARQEGGVGRHVHLGRLEHSLVRHQERAAALAPAARQSQQPQSHHRQHVHRAHAALRTRAQQRRQFWRPAGRERRVVTPGEAASDEERKKAPVVRIAVDRLGEGTQQRHESGLQGPVFDADGVLRKRGEEEAAHEEGRRLQTVLGERHVRSAKPQLAVRLDVHDAVVHVPHLHELRDQGVALPVRRHGVRKVRQDVAAMSRTEDAYTNGGLSMGGQRAFISNR